MADGIDMRIIHADLIQKQTLATPSVALNDKYSAYFQDDHQHFWRQS